MYQNVFHPQMWPNITTVQLVFIRKGTPIFSKKQIYNKFIFKFEKNKKQIIDNIS